MSEVYLSREGYEKLQGELKGLKETERPAVRQALQRAREFGDLSENAEYSAAKERLLFLRAAHRQARRDTQPGPPARKRGNPRRQGLYRCHRRDRRPREGATTHLHARRSRGSGF